MQKTSHYNQSTDLEDQPHRTHKLIFTFVFQDPSHEKVQHDCIDQFCNESLYKDGKRVISSGFSPLGSCQYVSQVIQSIVNQQDDNSNR